MAKIPPGPKPLFIDGKLVGQYISTGDTILDEPIAIAALEATGLLRKPAPRWMAARQQAIYFANTSTYLWKTELARPAPRRPDAVIPFIVNRAFAIELFLKALSDLHGKRQTGHKLVDLYDGLPQSAHAAITSKIDECAANRNLDEEPTVRVYLEELNTAFVDWRYAFEKGTLPQLRIEPTHFLQDLLFAACCVPHPPAEREPVDV